MTRHNIKRLVVLEEDGSMIGVLSVSDIVKKLARIVTDDYGRYRTIRNMLDEA
jgi:CBS domain-containing protein